MARVVLTGNLRQFTDGETEIEVEADTIRKLLRAAIDGQIYQDAWLEPVPPDSEVHLLPQIAGGSDERICRAAMSSYDCAAITFLPARPRNENEDVRDAPTRTREKQG
jgi:hypothetical protein